MRRPRFAIAAGILATTVLTASACSASLDADRDAGNQPPPEDCQPAFPASEQGSPNYYSVVVQLMNCQSAAIPLSIDIGLEQGKGTSLDQLNQVDAVGSGVIWDNGSGSGEGTPANIPGAGTNEYGSMVGFTTIPYWNGHSGNGLGDNASGGPFDSRVKSDNTLSPNFAGDWTVYGPSSMLQLEVFTSLPWPYNPAYYQNSSSFPGALATGTMLYRTQLGGGQVPIFTTTSDSTTGMGSTPPDSSFVPGTCWDPLVLQNGADGDPAVSAPNTDWSYTQTTTLGGTIPQQTWTNTLAGHFPPLNDRFQEPVVLLANGNVNTNGGQTNDQGLYNSANVPLTGPDNQAHSASPHYVKAYYRVMANQTCDGSTANLDNAVVIGGDLSQIDMSKASLKNVTLANSNLQGANLDSAVFGSANLSYADLTGADLYNVDLSDSTLIGTKLTSLKRASFLNLGNAKLLNLDLSTITSDQWGSMNLSGTQFCNVIEPGQTTPTNTNCNTLLKAQTTDWDKVRPQEECSSNAAQAANCIYVSVYNNSTRTLGLGAASCAVGQDGTIDWNSAPAFVSPLDTARWNWQIQPGQSADADGNTIDCGRTYANGADGKLRVRATSNGNAAQLTADAGFCGSASNADCLPLSIDGKTPLVVNVIPNATANAANAGRYYDIVICDASEVQPNSTSQQFPSGKCQTTPALPATPSS